MSTCATRCRQTCRTPASPRARSPRGGHRRSGRNQSGSTPCWPPPTMCCCSSTSLRNHRVAERQRRHVHAQAPVLATNGSGMHAHQSLWKDGKPLFHDESGYAGLSDLARHCIGGISAPRAVAAGLHQPDGQLLTASGARLRGPDQPGLQPAQTVRPVSASRSPATTRRPSA